MNQVASMMKSTQDESSNEQKLVHCTNSKAIEDGKCTEIMPIINCEYCNEELEQIGFYITNNIYMHWRSKGHFEKCTCKESKNHWEQFEKEDQKEKERKEKEESERQYRVRLKTMTKYCNLGEKFENRTFTSYNITNENKISYEVCISYAEKFKDLSTTGIGLLITGNYGAGKTHLVAAIAHDLMNQGYQPIFGNLIALLGKVKASYGVSCSKENEEKIINKYVSCDLLIIDDLGKDKPTEWMIEKLYYIINSRYENNKPIAITSNYNISKLIGRLTIGDNVETPEAIVSRMHEMCQGVDMKGCKDYRRSM